MSLQLADRTLRYSARPLVDASCARLCRGHPRRTPEKIRTFVLQLLFELLPDTARDKMAAAAEIEGHGNVIDFFTRKPRDE